jgi:glutamate dehydrogenase
MTSVHETLASAVERESKKFQECYLWLEQAMPSAFFKEIAPDNLTLITHSLMGFALQDYYSTIHLKGAAIVLCLDRVDADLRILEHYVSYGIKNYQAFVSKIPPPFPGINEPLRIAHILFTGIDESAEKSLSSETKQEIHQEILQLNPSISDQEFEHLISDLGSRFLNSLSPDQLKVALAMYFRAKTRDSCQYEIQEKEQWLKNHQGSLQIVLAWKNTPKYHFLFRLARTIHRHHLAIKRMNATYVNPYGRESILIMVLDLHGSDGRAASDVADIPEFLRELMTVKYFASFDAFDELLVQKGAISGNMANVLRALVYLVHQALVHIDPNLYTIENIVEGLCRHPDLTAKLCEAFKWKFHPEMHDYERYSKVREEFLALVDKLDTGQEEYDLRRKNILRQAMSMVHHTLKTNAFRMNFTALSFRLNPAFLDEIPFDRLKKFPEIPYGIFFIKGMHYFGFHIRFKDLARGGLRTVFPDQPEHVAAERNTIFTECYHLALTQHMKNKDIPEGGAKGIIFLKPYEHLSSEAEIYKKELEQAQVERTAIDEKIALFRAEQTTEYLYQAQRSFVESLTTLVNCEPDGTLRARRIVDYWRQPEYLYLGPDENMHDAMIQWIADYSKNHHYKPGPSFITSKLKTGINHKEYGVTSLGVNVYMREFLKHIGIDPERDSFTVKMSGGPDGDVAGNQILNLFRYYPKTAKLLALTDISGTAYDPQGLELGELASLFKQARPIRFFPPKKLHPGGFLVDKTRKRDTSPLAQQTVCWRMNKTGLAEEWLSGSEMNHLLRNNVLKTKADVFIPAGGRPRTLNESNYKDFLDETGKPTSLIIIEGANLYLTPQARREYEKLGTLIVKDSSANKTGVICSSFEVLCGLSLGEEEFYKNKDILVKEILERLEFLAYSEANLMLREYEETDSYMTDISNKISERINQFTNQILTYLNSQSLSNDPRDPLIQCYLSYCLPTLRRRFSENLLREIPDSHKKAIIACHVAYELVYRKGLHWFPSVVDILPLVLKELPELTTR